MKRLILLGLCGTLVACASAGTAVDASKVAAFKRGQTTYAQVVDAIGAPDSVLHNPDGSTAVAYSHIAAAPWGAKSESYAFVFDRNGVMTLDSATLVK